MRVVIADCSVVYEGRGSTVLPRSRYAIILKDDGSVGIHNDFGNKPINYMGKGTSLSIQKKGRQQIWRFSSKKEFIEIIISKIVSDTEFDLDGSPPDIIRFKTEKDLQLWLSKNPQAIGKNFEFIEREYTTGVGSVDLLVKHGEQYIVVEVKRKAMIDAVDQVKRYVDWLNKYGELGIVTGMVVAIDIRPNTLRHAENNNVTCVEISPY